MSSFFSKNRDAIILGVIGNSATGVLAAVLAWFNFLPPIYVPAWLAVASIGAGISLIIIRKKRRRPVPVVDQDFGVERVIIDGKRFIQCRFSGSQLVFLGDAPFGLERNDLHDIHISFEGSAGLSIDAFVTMYRDAALRPLMEQILKQRPKPAQQGARSNPVSAPPVREDHRDLDAPPSGGSA